VLRPDWPEIGLHPDAAVNNIGCGSGVKGGVGGLGAPGGLKAEGRNPKAEGNPKAETRNPSATVATGLSWRHFVLPRDFAVPFSIGLRISAFGFQICWRPDLPRDTFLAANQCPNLWI
jgi:hypothetical protein